MVELVKVSYLVFYVAKDALLLGYALFYHFYCDLRLSENVGGHCLNVTFYLSEGTRAEVLYYSVVF